MMSNNLEFIKLFNNRMDLIQDLILEHLGKMNNFFEEQMLSAEKQRYNRYLISSAKDRKILDLEFEVFNLKEDMKDLVDECPNISIHVHLPSRKKDEAE
jgi:hypothetical protein